jgi:hypothetical protein
MAHVWIANDANKLDQGRAGDGHGTAKLLEHLGCCEIDASL